MRCTSLAAVTAVALLATSASFGAVPPTKPTCLIPSPASITCNQYLDAQLEFGDCAYASALQSFDYDLVEVTGAAGQLVTLYASSVGFNPHLAIYAPGGELAGEGSDVNFDPQTDALHGTLTASGTWTIMVTPESPIVGTMPYHLEFLCTPRDACLPDDDTLCIDDQPGDRRYQVEIAYATSAGGGLSGNGHAVSLASLGMTNGGLFHFGNPANPEVLVKVFDQCNGPTHSDWVYFSAATDFGFSLTVTDTMLGRAKTYTNLDHHQAVPVGDTVAIPCQ